MKASFDRGGTGGGVTDRPLASATHSAFPKFV